MIGDSEGPEVVGGSGLLFQGGALIDPWVEEKA